MKDRLAKFMKNEGLAPSRFAEILGVPPSSISHLLAGRNKPGFDFLAKMTQRFPRLNPDWLLLGTGPVYRPTAGATMPVEVVSTSAISGTNPARNSAEAFAPTDDLFGASHEEVMEQQAEEEAYDPSYHPDYEPVAPIEAPRQVPRSAPIPEPAAAPREPAAPAVAMPKAAPRSGNATDNQQITRVIVCYADGSFETYV